MMNEKFLQGCLGFVAGSTVFFISSCASEPLTVPVPGGTQPNVISATGKADAKKYNEELAEAISNADQIVIKEHSHRVDFFGSAAGIHHPPQYTYKRVDLSDGDKMLFLESVRGLDGEVRMDGTDCMFVSHHTIDFYEQGDLKSSMKICYQCLEVKWNGTSLSASKDVFKALSPAISRAGMKTHREWDTMAKTRYEEERKAAVNPGDQGPPVAKWVVGQEGKKVVNPFTGTEVDVEGIPGNTKVRDPNDKDSTHVFKVPHL